LTFTGIEHVESKFDPGVGPIKIHSIPATNMAQAVARRDRSYGDRSTRFHAHRNVMPPFVMR